MLGLGQKLSLVAWERELKPAANLMGNLTSDHVAMIETLVLEIFCHYGREEVNV